ncbi:MAG: molybdopterin-dependent oxidoreductase [Thermoleophilia bacterium]|nr:molybdopterin-dependent oxidoreductase [Thermoleophilia bacterium]
MSDTSERLRLVVNGSPVELEVSPERSLLAVLREDLGLTGTKEGCSKGHCGTCAVLVDGKVTLSCHVKAVDVAGREVVTIESLGTREAPHPVQRAFVETGAVQCGFCTPGAIISAKALLDANPDPTRDAIVAALNRHLCRCTGYVKLVDAVQLAGRHLRGETTPVEAAGAQAAGAAEVTESLGIEATVAGGNSRGAIGRSLPRRDAWEKVLGEARFAADITLPDMQHAQVVRSPHHHARILAIDTTTARALPGVAAVITAADVPGRNAVAIFRPDQPILATDRVRHRGEPVALVVADSLETARTARDLVVVEWQVLPAVMTPEEALAEGAPRIHDDVPNEVFSRRLARGDAAGALAAADVVVEGEFSTPYNEHAYLEPEAGLACMDGDRVVVMVGTQNAQHCRTEIAKVLAVDPERVRVIQTTTGGGFGGKLDVPFPALLALAAWVTRRPIKLVLTREESFLDSTKRHPFRMHLRLGATGAGDLIALQVDFTANTGAYMSFGAGVVTRAVVHAGGPYRIPNIETVGRAVHTNGPVSGAMRGFGVPQMTFALECLLDELAGKLGQDPLELRRRNGYRDRDLTASGQQLEARVPYLRTLEAVEPAYRRARQAAAEFNVSAKAERGGRRRGVGLASMWFGPGKTSLAEKSYAFLELEAGGDVRLVTTAADIGQGLETVMAQITAEELRMSYERVLVSTKDTDGSPDGGFTCASRQTYNTGNAVRVAAMQLKESVTVAAAEMMGRPPAGLLVADGEVRSPGAPEECVTFRELVAAGHTRRYFGAYAADVSDLDADGQGVPYETYTFGTQVAEVEVDPRRGAVKILAVHVAHDVGTVINPQAVQGQLEGGALMGIGFALQEEYLPGETESFRDYRIPRAKDMPAIDVVHLDTPHERGPFGAAGAGECAQMPTGPAIANALHDALGLRLRDLPITPARLRAAVAAERSG